MTWLVLTHLVVSALATRCCKGTLGWALGFWVLVLPGLGAVSALLIWLAVRFLPAPQGDLLEEFKEHTEPEAVVDRRARLSSLPLLEHLEVQPLLDLLESPDIGTRRAVIEAMAARGGPEMVAQIKRCINDPRPEIYQLAVAKLSQLQEKHSQNLTRARQLAQTPKRENLLALAEAYLRYLQSGLVEAAITPLYWQTLVDLYDRILEVAPEDPETRVKRLQALLALGVQTSRPEVRERAFDEAQKGMFSHPKALELQAELSYYRRDWDRMREPLRELLAGSVDSVSRQQYAGGPGGTRVAPPWVKWYEWIAG